MNACYVDAEYGQGTMQKGGNSGKILLVTKKGKNIAEFAAKYPSCRQTISI